MADIYDGSYESYQKLRAGKKIICPDCKKGYFVPFNTTADKAHSFKCSNENCDGYIHFDPMIIIE